MDIILAIRRTTGLRPSTRWVLWFLIGIGALSALWVGWRRSVVEGDNRRVEIILDWDEVRSLANETGTGPADLLDQFYRAGARGIAVGEETIGELQALRRIEIEAPEEERGVSALPAEMVTRLNVPDPLLRPASSTRYGSSGTYRSAPMSRRLRSRHRGRISPASPSASPRT